MTTKFKLTMKSLEIEGTDEQLRVALEQLRIESDGEVVEVDRIEHAEVLTPAPKQLPAPRPRRKRGAR